MEMDSANAAEQKYRSLYQDFSLLESENAQLRSDFEDRVVEIAAIEAEKRLLLESLDVAKKEMNEKTSDIKSYLDKKIAENNNNQSLKWHTERHQELQTCINSLQEENKDLKQKLENCEAETEKIKRSDELKPLPFSSFTRGVDDSRTSNRTEGSLEIISKVPAGVSGTALAASLLRDGWSLAKIYEKYQEAVDALRHEQLGRKEAELILQRVLSEIEEKAGFIQEERGEYERMVEAYSLANQQLQDSVSEQSNMEKFIMELKADARRRERENILLQKDISDLQKQVTILLKECRDIQLRCGASRDVDDEDEPVPQHLDDEMDSSEVEAVISEHLLKFKDINGLVEQNVKLRSLVRGFSEHIETSEMKLKEKFETVLKKESGEASSKLAIALKRAERQGQANESLLLSVAMYKRLYELHCRSSDTPPGRKKLLHELEDLQETTERAREKAFEGLEEDLAKARSEMVALKSERDKLAMEAIFARNNLDSVREECNRKLRESSESLLAAEETSRKLSMEVSVLKQEKEVLSEAEKKASLSQRFYKEEAFAAERSQQEAEKRQRSLESEIASLREEILAKSSQIEAMNIQMSTFMDERDREHEQWCVAQRDYEKKADDLLGEIRQQRLDYISFCNKAQKGGGSQEEQTTPVKRGLKRPTPLEHSTESAQPPPAKRPR